MRIMTAKCNCSRKAAKDAKKIVTTQAQAKFTLQMPVCDRTQRTQRLYHFEPKPDLLLVIVVQKSKVYLSITTNGFLCGLCGLCGE